jgi:uncharacterized protein (TIGR03437 family)
MGLELDRRQSLKAFGGSICGLVSSLSAFAQTPGAPLSTKVLRVPVADSDGKAKSHFSASCQQTNVNIGGGESVVFSLIPRGRYEMGSVEPPVHSLIESSLPKRRLTIDSFFMGSTAVTRGQWRRITQLPKISIDLPSGSLFSGAPADESLLPMDVLSIPVAEEAIRRLRTLTGLPLRFPSEAEWEYACRAGTTTRFYMGDVVSRELVNFNDGVARPLGLNPCGSLQAPNRFGLHDMHGNVLELCGDWVNRNYAGAPVDGSAWTNSGDSSSRIARGGCYLFNVNIASSAARYSVSQFAAFSGLGFRLAMNSPVSIEDPVLAQSGIVNAANPSIDSFAPGTIVSMFGECLGEEHGVGATLTESGMLPTEIASVSVEIGGKLAPMLFAGRQQINVVVPFGVPRAGAVPAIVYRKGQSSLPIYFSVVEAAPALFTRDQSGSGIPVALLENGSVLSESNPVRRGEVVSLFATGAGKMEPELKDGQVAGLVLSRAVLPVEAYLDNIRIPVLYSGSAPGLIGGVLQLNIQVPMDARLGVNEFRFTVGGISSPRGVLVPCS